jgi:mono/diheme cytochrome c family protein
VVKRLCAATLLCVTACATQQALAPVEPSAAASFEAGLVRKGAELAALGGRALRTPFGTIYGTNITPEAETGIGAWSEAAFRRALREGLDREGRHLYPAFPYEYYTRLTDEDVGALYAYLKTREPVRARTPPALNAANPAPLPWSGEQLFTYLRTGIEAQHAIAAGPMDPVVRNLARVAEDDVRALADYFAALLPSGPRRNAEAKPDSGGPGAAIYAGACGTCHDRGRDASSGSALELAAASALTLPTSANLVRITLEGIAPPAGEPGRSMPGFAQALTDAQVKDSCTTAATASAAARRRGATSTRRCAKRGRQDDHARSQRQSARGAGRSRDAASLRAHRPPAVERREIRLRAGTVRRLHRARRRRARVFLRRAYQCP